jgi:hypothetical protein
MWTLDLANGRLTGHQKTPVVASVATGEHIWATLAGRREGVLVNLLFGPRADLR